MKLRFLTFGSQKKNVPVDSFQSFGKLISTFLLLGYSWKKSLAMFPQQKKTSLIQSLISFSSGNSFKQQLLFVCLTGLLISLCSDGFNIATFSLSSRCRILCTRRLFQRRFFPVGSVT